MARWERLLERMKANPQGDWSIGDIQTVARAFETSGLAARAPKRGLHDTISHPDHPDILTIPARKPIKPIYVRRFVSIIESISWAKEGHRLICRPNPKTDKEVC